MGSNNRTLISMDKQYVLRSGRSVALATLSGQGGYPVVGQFPAAFVKGAWSACSWDIFGKCRNRDPEYDLVEVDPYKGLTEGDLIEFSTDQGRVYYKVYAGEGKYYQAGAGSPTKDFQDFSNKIEDFRKIEVCAND